MSHFPLRLASLGASVVSLSALLLLGSAGLAFADAVTSAGSITDVSGTVTFTGPPTNDFTAGPVQVGSDIGQDIAVFSTNSGSVVNYNGIYGLGANGEWDGGGTNGYIGLNDSAGSLTIAFNSAPVSAVGAFLNYSPGSGADDVIMAVYDSNDILLESYDLSTLHPIDTPGETNGGAFRGIVRASADIKYFTLSNDYVAADNLIFHSNAVSTPEPGAILTGLVLFGMTGLGLVRGRMRTAKTDRLFREYPRQRHQKSRQQVGKCQGVGDSKNDRLYIQPMHDQRLLPWVGIDHHCDPIREPSFHLPRDFGTAIAG